MEGLSQRLASSAHLGSLGIISFPSPVLTYVPTYGLRLFFYYGSYSTFVSEWMKVPAYLSICLSIYLVYNPPQRLMAYLLPSYRLFLDRRQGFGLQMGTGDDE
ncbi:hypothetical protein GGR50DRAFT_665977 [Xylaria sp. CBS 124048]|nr:hypothetical protein GGR50DRAFT_665977 [Xylaria sp. CBS 124048]